MTCRTRESLLGYRAFAAPNETASAGCYPCRWRGCTLTPAEIASGSWVDDSPNQLIPYSETYLWPGRTYYIMLSSYSADGRFEYSAVMPLTQVL